MMVDMTAWKNPGARANPNAILRKTYKPSWVTRPAYFCNHSTKGILKYPALISRALLNANPCNSSSAYAQATRGWAEGSILVLGWIRLAQSLYFY